MTAQIATSSAGKWPVKIKVVRVSDNTLNHDLDMYFISGLMNQEQLRTLENKLTILAKFEVGEDRVVATTEVNHKQLEEVLVGFRKLAKSWRGQYQVLMKEFVKQCDEAMKS